MFVSVITYLAVITFQAIRGILLSHKNPLTRDYVLDPGELSPGAFLLDKSVLCLPYWIITGLPLNMKPLTWFKALFAVSMSTTEPKNQERIKIVHWLKKKKILRVSPPSLV